MYPISGVRRPRPFSFRTASLAAACGRGPMTGSASVTVRLPVPRCGISLCSYLLACRCSPRAYRPWSGRTICSEGLSRPRGVRAGLFLVAWIAVQLLVLQRYFFLQPLIACLGIAEILLARTWQLAGTPNHGRNGRCHDAMTAHLGNARPRPPATAGIWTAQVTGTGTRALV